MREDALDARIGEPVDGLELLDGGQGVERHVEGHVDAARGVRVFSMGERHEFQDEPAIEPPVSQAAEDHARDAQPLRKQKAAPHLIGLAR